MSRALAEHAATTQPAIGTPAGMSDEVTEQAAVAEERERTLAALAVACVEAGETIPCAHCGGQFAEQWGTRPWHCFSCKQPLDTVRASAEDAAKAAAEAVDALLLNEGRLSAEGRLRHAARGVSVRFLKQLALELPPGTTTGAVVGLIVKPRTARTRCRYTELPEMRGSIGKPKAFVSHTWGGAPLTPTPRAQPLSCTSRAHRIGKY